MRRAHMVTWFERHEVIIECSPWWDERKHDDKFLRHLRTSIEKVLVLAEREHLFRYHRIGFYRDAEGNNKLYIVVPFEDGVDFRKLAHQLAMEIDTIKVEEEK